MAAENDMRMDGKSLDVVKENIAALKEIFPEIVEEGKIDFDKLKLSLGDEIDAGVEKYNFTWHGKNQSIRISQTPSMGTLRPCIEESVDWDNTKNLYIEGDNLEVLKLLQKSYLGKIKIMFIDPPYNTGHEFVYNDSFNDNISNYIEKTKQMDETGKPLSANVESDGHYHTNWLNMMYPRLKLARNLLSDDGVIFITIGQDELINLSIICNEIFGESNLISTLSHVMKSGGGKGQYFSPNIEYILVYAKSRVELKCFREPISDEIIEKLYTSVETNGPRAGEKYRPFGLCQKGLDPMRGCSNQRYYVEAPDGTLLIPPGNVMPAEKKDGAQVVPETGDDLVWRWTRDRYLQEKSLGNIGFNKSNGVLIDSEGNPAKWNVYTKMWLSDRQEDGMVPTDLLTKWENRHSSKELQSLDIPFSFAKSSELIKYLISIVDDNENCTVLDFFSGSGTTAHAVMNLNKTTGGKRNFILVQLPEICDVESEQYKKGFKNICEIGKERIRRVGLQLNNGASTQTTLFDDKASIDVGFKVFKLDSSNIKTWNPSGDLKQSLLEYGNNLKSELGRTDLDIVYEILLKLGLNLTSQIEREMVSDKTIFSVSSGSLMICLDDIENTDVAEKMTEL